MKSREDRERLFAHCPIGWAVFRLAVPTVISQIILVLYNMADTFFIGLSGNDAMIASATVCMPAFMALSALSNLFGVGGASAIARALGAGNRSRAHRAAAFSFWGCALATALYSLAAWGFRDGLTDFLGGRNAEVHAMSVQYLYWTVVVGGLATSMNALLGHLVRAEGGAVQAGIGVALGGLLNIGLDPLFMFVLMEPGNEVMGAAIATFLSNLIAAVYFAVLLIAHRRTTVLRLRPSMAALRDGLPGEILSTGLPACLMTLCENLSFAVMDSLMVRAGTAMQAGLGVAKKVNMLAHCMARGMAQGVLPLIGYNYASGDHRRMRSAVLISTAASVTLATLCMVVSLSFSGELVGAFIRSDSGSVEWGARFLRILSLGGSFSACAYAFISFFQATGESLKSFLLAILRKGVLDIPLMFLLRGLIPDCGVVWATPIADVVCCAAAVCLFAKYSRRLFARSELCAQ